MKTKPLLTGFFLTLTLPALADIYTPQEAFDDLQSEPLKFVGRDYPNADLGPGGNYVCVYKNSRVYVRHEGCRPSAQQTLSVFSAKIASRNGGMVEIYIEKNRDAYRLAEAGPDMEGIWKLTSTNTPVIPGELSFRDLITLERTVWNKTYNLCYISKSLLSPEQMPQTRCMGGASDERGDLETVWHDPFAHGLKAAHDTILFAPRK